MRQLTSLILLMMDGGVAMAADIENLNRYSDNYKEK